MPVRQKSESIDPKRGNAKGLAERKGVKGSFPCLARIQKLELEIPFGDADGRRLMRTHADRDALVSAHKFVPAFLSEKSAFKFRLWYVPKSSQGKIPASITPIYD